MMTSMPASVSNVEPVTPAMGDVTVNQTGGWSMDCLLWNYTMLDCFNTTNTSVSPFAQREVVSGADSLRLWAFLLLIFPVFTFFGNVLVVLSVYRERSLQTVTNYFIVSLAVADIMVGVLVMPLGIYTEVGCIFCVKSIVIVYYTSICVSFVFIISVYNQSIKYLQYSFNYNFCISLLQYI